MNNPPPTITAVMFVYNEERYIEQMLTSINNQILAVSKIIIIDDYSTDRTLEIVGNFQQKNSNIEVFKSKKKGKVFAYVTGLEKVATDYFFICAGDDFLLPDYTVGLYSEMEKKKLHFIYARYFTTDSQLQHPIEVKRKKVYKRNEIIRANRVSGYLFGRKEIIKHILPIPTEVSFEDWVTSLKLANHYNQVHLSEKPLFYYRKHESSTSEKLRNVGMRKRDIKFINFILNEDSIITENDKKILEIRLRFYKQLIGEYSFFEIIKLLFNSNLFAIDKIRLLILLAPFINNDDDSQRLILKVAKIISLK